MIDWQAIENHRRTHAEIRITDLFDSDPGRFDDFSIEFGDLLFDYSKTHIDKMAKELLTDLARKADLEAARDAMFAGETINVTEGRAVLHTALRNRSRDPVHVDGADVMPGVRESLTQTSEFAEAVRRGRINSSDGGPFRDVVNIGIGGSDLGPMMAVRALSPYHDGPRLHFVSNVDGAHLSDTLSGLDPRRTLFIIASKTFTTIETMTNARSARRWIAGALGESATGKHFAAVSSAVSRASEFGISGDRVFGFEDWVGGRYSLWGPIGLPIMIAVGAERFGEFLSGAHEIDIHFRTAPLAHNMPVWLGLVGLWHNTVCGWPTRVILPYDQRLEYLPAYLQQLDMESNGKSVGKDGAPLTRRSGPIVWGTPGTNGQHAYFQLIHQGTEVIPCEFLVAANSHEADMNDHHELLLANCLAQSEALMRGRTLDEAKRQAASSGVDEDIAPHRVFAGNRPSTTLLYRQLDPVTLGRIIALYEHRVFVEGVLWGLNSFDQWGVELGKELATQMLPLVRGEGQAADFGPASSNLAAAVRRLKD